MITGRAAYRNRYPRPSITSDDERSNQYVFMTGVVVIHPSTAVDEGLSEQPSHPYIRQIHCGRSGERSNLYGRAGNRTRNLCVMSATT